MSACVGRREQVPLPNILVRIPRVPDVLNEPPYRTTTHHPAFMVHWWLLAQSHPKPGPINPKKEQDPTHSNEQNAEKK